MEMADAAFLIAGEGDAGLLCRPKPLLDTHQIVDVLIDDEAR